MSKFLRYCTLLFMILLATGCTDNQAVRKYRNAHEFTQSPDSSWVMLGDAIPRDASNIEVRSDADTGLVLISYKVKDSLSSIDRLDMTRLGAQNYSNVLNKLGFTRPKPREIYYRCNSRSTALGNEKIISKEVIFIGNDGATRFYWNSTSEELVNLLCVPGATSDRWGQSH